MEENVRYITAYNKYVDECQQRGISPSITFPKFKGYCKQAEEMYGMI